MVLAGGGVHDEGETAACCGPQMPSLIIGRVWMMIQKVLRKGCSDMDLGLELGVSARRILCGNRTWLRVCTWMVENVGPRLQELVPAARGSQDTGLHIPYDPACVCVCAHQPLSKHFICIHNCCLR